MLKMMSAKEFVWNEIMEAGMDIESFKDCYRAISRVVPKDWNAIPENLLILFSDLVNSAEKESIKRTFLVDGRDLQSFSVYLMQKGYATSKDLKVWDSIECIREEINNRRSELEELKKELNNGIDEFVVEEYEQKKIQLRNFFKLYYDALTLESITLSDGRVLKVSNDWYIFL